MYSSLKNMYVSVVLSTIIILLNTDLSCLTPYLMAARKAVETREIKKVFEKQKYAVVLPNQAVLTVRDATFKSMATYLQEYITVDSDSATDKTLNVSHDTSCRGSPLSRSP
jgi:hypothetical protein